MCISKNLWAYQLYTHRYAISVLQHCLGHLRLETSPQWPFVVKTHPLKNHISMLFHPHGKNSKNTEEKKVLWTKIEALLDINKWNIKNAPKYRNDLEDKVRHTCHSCCTASGLSGIIDHGDNMSMATFSAENVGPPSILHWREKNHTGQVCFQTF